jgi:hypothetical protein
MQQVISRQNDGLSGVVCPYTPQKLSKLTLQPRKEAITREIPYLVQALTR